jgi:hypothetical protein
MPTNSGGKRKNPGHGKSAEQKSVVKKITIYPL